jgi:hypothetical protein
MTKKRLDNPKRKGKTAKRDRKRPPEQKTANQILREQMPEADRQIVDALIPPDKPPPKQFRVWCQICGATGYTRKPPMVCPRCEGEMTETPVAFSPDLPPTWGQMRKCTDGTGLRGMNETGGTILDEANELVHGSRQKDYGHPRDDFAKTACMITGILLPKLKDGATVNTDEVALIMIAVKMSRLVHSWKRDSAVDICGYAATMEMLHAPAGESF